MEKVDFKQLVLERKERILKDISDSVKIPSVTGTPECQEALAHTLQLGKDMGFKVESFHNDTSGHICYGDEKEFIGVLGHLDVVPVSPKDWDRDPFSGEYDDEFINGRGTQDDKGPTIIALHAIDIIQKLGLPIKKGVKVILGTQEEGGDWSDIENYFKTNPAPICGFTPDSSFPLIYAEKHIIQINIGGKMKFEKVKSFKGGSAVNSVPASAEVEFNLSADEVSAIVEEFKKNNPEAKVELDGTTVRLLGLSAHSKNPEKGISAIWAMIRLIDQVEENAVIKKYIENHLDDVQPTKLGLAHVAVDGPLTINNGKFNFDGTDFDLWFDFRSPNELNPDDIVNKVKSVWDGFEFKEVFIERGIFKAPDDPIIVTLEKAYRDVTGDMETKLIASGGGTYAKAAPNTVAYGAIFPGDESRVHQKNERLSVDSLVKACEIYCHAIYNLIKD